MRETQKRRVVHIAPLIAPLTESVAGGAERMVMILASAQHAAGNVVEVIAADGSSLPAGISRASVKVPPSQIIPVETGRASSQGYSKLEKEALLDVERRVFEPIKRYLQQESKNISVVHNHAYDFFPLFELHDLGLPIVHTLHLPPIVPWINAGFRRIRSLPSHVSYVTVSRRCAQTYLEEVGVTVPVVYNGFDFSSVPFSPTPENFFLWVGRISPEKGLHTAIDLVVDAFQVELVVIGRVYDENYFEESIRHRLDHPRIKYLGFLPHHEVLQQMSKAQALIFPLQWEEPLATTVIESLSTGTPVVCYHRGSMAEIIEDGVNGFLVSTEEEFVKQMRRVGKLSREQCRKSVEERFVLQTMVEGYDFIYNQVCKKS